MIQNKEKEHKGWVDNSSPSLWNFPESIYHSAIPSYSDSTNSLDASFKGEYKLIQKKNVIVIIFVSAQHFQITY